MDFRHAFFNMLDGKAVKLPDWGGYWVWEKGTVMMHLRTGEVMDIRDTKTPGYTFSNIASKDWEVCEPKLINNDSIDKVSSVNKVPVIPIKEDETPIITLRKPEVPSHPTEDKTNNTEPSIKNTKLSDIPKIDKPSSIEVQYKYNNRFTWYSSRLNVAICFIINLENYEYLYIGIGKGFNDRKYCERWAEIDAYKNYVSENGIGRMQGIGSAQNFIYRLIERNPKLDLTTGEIRFLASIIHVFSIGIWNASQIDENGEIPYIGII